MHELTLGEWLEYHVDFRAAGVERSTAAAYRGHIRTMPADLLYAPLTEITPDHVAEWIRSMKDAGLKPGTIAGKQTFLSSALDHAVKRGHIPVSPAQDQPLPRLERTAATRYLTPTQYHVLHGEIPARYQPFIEFLVSSGARWGEATALQPADVDLQAGTVWIRRTWKPRVGAFRGDLGPPKTAGSTRLINIHHDTLSKLDYSNDWLFVTTHGNPLNPSWFHSQIWKPAVTRACLPFRPRVHDLRHTCASWMIAAGVPIAVVSKHLGHDSITTTVRTYTHVDRTDLAAAAASIRSRLTAE